MTAQSSSVYKVNFRFSKAGMTGVEPTTLKREQSYRYLHSAILTKTSYEQLHYIFSWSERALWYTIISRFFILHYLFLSGSNLGDESLPFRNNIAAVEEAPAPTRACQIGEDSSAADAGTSKSDMRDLLNWRHLLPPIGQLGDECLDEACQYVTYAFKNVHVTDK